MVERWQFSLCIFCDWDFEEELHKLKEILARDFEIKNLGNLKYFLAMEIAQSGTLGVSLWILWWIQTRNSGLIKIVLQLRQEDTNALLGTHLSFTCTTWFNILSECSESIHEQTRSRTSWRSIQNPSLLKDDHGEGNFLRKGINQKVEVFADVDLTDLVIDRRFTTGYCTYVWGNFVMWQSKKPLVVARNSEEVEFWETDYLKTQSSYRRTNIGVLIQPSSYEHC